MQKTIPVDTIDDHPESAMNRILAIAITALIIIGCSPGHSPGEVEVIANGKVYHLANGILVQESRDGGNHYYLVESTKADYELTKEGLSFVVKGEEGTTVVLHRPPEGNIAAGFANLNGDGPESTRFTIDEEKFSDFFQKLTSTTTVQDVYDHRR